MYNPPILYNGQFQLLLLSTYRTYLFTIPQNISQTKLQKKRTFNFDRSNFVQMKNKSLFDEYEIKEKLGESAYSCVYKVQQKTTGFIRAVKTIKCKHIDKTAFGNEIKILKTVDHPNII